MNRFLLTYEVEDGYGEVLSEYDWFETEREMKEFIEVQNVTVVEALEIIECREIL